MQHLKVTPELRAHLPSNMHLDSNSWPVLLDCHQQPLPFGALGTFPGTIFNCMIKSVSCSWYVYAMILRRQMFFLVQMT